MVPSYTRQKMELGYFVFTAHVKQSLGAADGMFRVSTGTNIFDGMNCVMQHNLTELSLGMCFIVGRVGQSV
jgi:hypothetical protein